MTPERERQIVASALRREEKRAINNIEETAAAGLDRTSSDRRAAIESYLNGLETARQYLLDVLELAVKYENPA